MRFVSGAHPALSLPARRTWVLRISGGRVVAVAAVSVLAALAVIPLYWMVVTALQTPQLSMRFPPEIWPSQPTLDNFRLFFQRPYVGRWSVNSLVVASSVTVAVVLVSTLAGYTFAKKRFLGRNLLFWIYVGSMMVPGQVTLIPLYILATRMGLQDTYLGLIFPAVAAPFGTFLMKQFLQTLPSEILDAARIDGCSEFGIFHRVVMPLAKPGMAVLAIFTFVEQWNDFLWPLVITNRAAMRTLSVGLALVQEEVPLAFNLLMAAATYAAVPMLVVFLAFQRYFLQGVTVGALKG
ncbi:carbohydrate ABC transporter permease [Geochorda subterranea]|uniref:Carbohydrate ABC transporter permease n=1 Tax=Geochorda subterranea TaxID=3109564 RepID=A0ABZ1BPJ1_9FIRM|nr:carbohydrate ABC transporter permease [Limnochorda sp. LNt]WRP14629.1 carbohydrate ABC transporter permease [Limnochorda sp. LNt]